MRPVCGHVCIFPIFAAGVLMPNNIQNNEDLLNDGDEIDPNDDWPCSRMTLGGSAHKSQALIRVAPVMAAQNQNYASPMLGWTAAP